MIYQNNIIRQRKLVEPLQSTYVTHGRSASIIAVTRMIRPSYPSFWKGLGAYLQLRLRHARRQVPGQLLSHPRTRLNLRRISDELAGTLEIFGI